MSVNFGRAADPGYFVMGIALPLNRPVGPNRDEDDALPCYVVNALPGKPDRFSRNAIVSVHTFAKTTAEAKAAADDLDYLIRCTMPDDPITLPDGSTAKGEIGERAPPAWIDYRDPNIERVHATYPVQIRFT
jgi:hypothetical protein